MNSCRERITSPVLQNCFSFRIEKWAYEQNWLTMCILLFLTSSFISYTRRILWNNNVQTSIHFSVRDVAILWRHHVLYIGYRYLLHDIDKSYKIETWRCVYLCLLNKSFDFKQDKKYFETFPRSLSATKRITLHKCIIITIIKDIIALKLNIKYHVSLVMFKRITNMIIILRFLKMLYVYW